MAGVLVHEWIAPTGGSEQVLDEFVRAFPDADVHALWNDAPDRIPGEVSESWIARTPLRKNKALALPFMPAAWRQLHSERAYDWALISSHLFAHHARFRGVNRAIPKLVYAHTPARYVWEPELDQRGAGFAPRAASTILKPLDRRRAREATAIAANSEFTRARIQRTWDRDATVIYPPVDTTRIIAGGAWADRVRGHENGILEQLPATFLLGASRFIPYKRLDLVIDAGEASDLPVVLAGSGPERERLASRAANARVPVLIVDNPSNELLYALFQAALVLVFPAVEDFGIMPVEAMAAGTPVVAPAIGGAAESVELLGGGAAIESFDAPSWEHGIRAAASIDRADLQARSTLLSSERFRSDVQRWVDELTRSVSPC
ncbi:glycosyltransferase [Microbacterium sp. NPDC056057]|uniref:glycosyltransferase n=1 Tax=Microbacterium sp. NPDC056057 TaxID=3345699 RepID=UPI0035D86730